MPDATSAVTSAVTSTVLAPSSTTSSPATTPSTTPSTEVDEEDDPAVETPVVYVDVEPRLTLTGPGLGGDAVEVLSPEELRDGDLLFVSEIEGGLPGTTVTVADADLRIRHRVEVGEPPFLEAGGWPGVGLVRQPDHLSLLDTTTGELTELRPDGGGELVLLEIRPGQRFAAAVEVGGGTGTFLIDFVEQTLVAIPGSLRSGAPRISPDGQWVISVPDMGARGAGSLVIVRPDQLDVELLTLTPRDGEIFERWFFDDEGELWVTSRPLDTTAGRLEHRINLADRSVVTVLEWGPSEGYRIIEVTGHGLIVQERSTSDHLALDADGVVLARISRPVDNPKVYGNFAAYIDENDVELVDLRDGSKQHFTAIGSPTPSEIDMGGNGQFWIADGYATGEIGLFRVDLRQGAFVDHRGAVAELPDSEHFFSFDETRFSPEGFSAVVYQGDDQSWIVRLDADGGSEVFELPPGHRATDVSLSPTGDGAVVLAGRRTGGVRESFASVLDFSTGEFADGEGSVREQRLAVWLYG